MTKTVATINARLIAHVQRPEADTFKVVFIDGTHEIMTFADYHRDVRYRQVSS